MAESSNCLFVTANAAQAIPEIIEVSEGGFYRANDEKMYLYDIIEIKKETSNPLEP